MKNFILCLILLIHTNLKADDIFKRAISGDIIFTSIINDNDSTFIIAGKTVVEPTSGILIRVNKIGDVLWSKKIENSLKISFNELTFNFDTTKIVVAGTLTDINNLSDGLLVEFDLDGNLIWQKSYHEDSINWIFTSLSYVAPNKLTIAANYFNQWIGTYGTLLIADSSGVVNKSLPIELTGSYSAPVLLPNGSLFLTAIYRDLNGDISFRMNIDSGYSFINWKGKYFPGGSLSQYATVSPKSTLLKNGNLIFSVGNESWLTTRYNNTVEIDSNGNALWTAFGGPSLTVLENEKVYIQKSQYVPGFFSVEPTGTSYTNYELVSSIINEPIISSIGNELILLTGDGFVLMDSISCNVINTGTQGDSGFVFTTPIEYSLPLLSFSYTFDDEISNITESPGPLFYIDCFISTFPENSPVAFNIFPNPTINQLNVELDFLLSKKVEYSISDISGKIILSEITKLLPGENSFSIDTKNLSPGIYFINLIIDEKSITKKFLITN